MLKKQLQSSKWRNEPDALARSKGVHCAAAAGVGFKQPGRVHICNALIGVAYVRWW